MAATDADQKKLVRVFVTRHSVYVVRDGVCVAVRDRESGNWVPNHTAIGRTLDGGLKLGSRGGMEPHDDPRPGDRLYFSDDLGYVVLTSEVVACATTERDPVSILSG